MKQKIFINYRKEISDWQAVPLYNELTKTFGEECIFKDFNTIKPGEDFVDSIDKALETCDVLLVLIGRGWLTVKNKKGITRIHDPEDFVRIEIAAALKRNIRVIPVLFDDATVPSAEDLPEDLKKLARRQSISVDKTRFQDDTEKLVQAIRQELSDKGTSLKLTTTGRKILAGCIILLLISFAYYFFSGDPGEQTDLSTSDSTTIAVPEADTRPDLSNNMVSESGAGIAKQEKQTSKQTGANYDPANDPVLLVDEGLKEYESKNYSRAFELWSNAAERENHWAINNLATLYRDGLGVAMDKARALQLFRKAADAGNPNAMNAIGYHYFENNDNTNALIWLERSAALDNSDAMNNLGRVYDRMGDYDQAFQWYVKAADRNDPWGLQNLATFYRDGQVVERDESYAAELFKRAADLGNSDAMVNLGVLLRDGRGIEVNYERAFQLFSAASNKGNSQGMANLGFLLEKGWGVPQNFPEALNWYRKAASLKNDWAINKLKTLGEKL